MINPLKKRIKISPKVKIEYFNYGGLGHFATCCPISKDIKKPMQDTWSDMDSEESDSTTSENAR